MVDVAQLVRASVCGTEGRGFEPLHLPHLKAVCKDGLFCFQSFKFHGGYAYKILNIISLKFGTKLLAINQGAIIKRAKFVSPKKHLVEIRLKVFSQVCHARYLKIFYSRWIG